MINLHEIGTMAGTAQMPLADIFKDVIEDMKVNILPLLQEQNPKIQTIHFEHGSVNEIRETLLKYDLSPTKRYEKYPLIILIQDYPEKMGKESGYYADMTVQVGIAYHTKSDYRAATRYEKNFKPVLYPLYYALLEGLSNHPAIAAHSARSLKHTKWDRVNLGKEVFLKMQEASFDYIDAIELQNLELTVDRSSDNPHVDCPTVGVGPVYAPKPLVDLFKEVIEEMRANVLPLLQAEDPKIETIHFEHGSIDEIRETLLAYDKSAAKRYEKYPLVVLIQDFPEKRGLNGGYYTDTVVQMAIINHTSKEYRAATRYEKNFQPVLLPLYYALLEEIANHYGFVCNTARSIKHTKWDRVNLGKEAFLKMREISFDYVDAIELQDVELTIDNNNCLEPITTIIGL